MNFKDKLYIEYPIPEDITIWGGNGLNIETVVDIDSLVESSVSELASDILITCYMCVNGLRTRMPEGTVTVQSAMLTNNYMFQGNRLVKVTYDKGMNMVYLRYFPATVTYKRKLKVSDLEELEGDRLIYVKSYMLWKMAEKELSVLKAVNMQVDNGQVDWEVLTSFRDKMYNAYQNMKKEIMLYASVN